MRSFHIEVPDLQASLFRLVRQIPKGRVSTYGDLANALGDQKAAIWVSEVLNDPPEAFRQIAHRVVRANGEPVRFPKGAVAKLIAEGVPVQDQRAEVQAARFTAFENDRPLERLQREQEAMAKRTKLEPLPSSPDFIAAVDVSYRADGVAFAAYVLMRPGDEEPLWTTIAKVPVSFPYIPGYLSYRELPAYAELLRSVIDSARIAPLLLVDGSGILHPRRTGIATQLGVLADHPTVGVSKSLLCGTIVYDDSFGEGTGRVVHKGDTLAAVLPPTRRGKRPIFVSPGHRCTLDDAVAAVLHCRLGFRLPEPIRHADALSRLAARGGLEAM